MMNNKLHYPVFLMNKINHHYALLNIRNSQNFSEGIHKATEHFCFIGTVLGTELSVVLGHLHAGRTQFTVCAVIHCKISIL